MNDNLKKMKEEYEKWRSNCIDIEISEKEIDELIFHFTQLKEGATCHYHNEETGEDIFYSMKRD